ncbi:hypothetical protein [Nocardia sp. XZ_19_385]|uniref:hypothetical protein n=1 Tax=Nocardia sp. XZ_19_385 TaxID=2769488 RepID=UPI0035CD051A
MSAPLGPNSLTWKHFGDIRSMLILGRAGTLQNMHPVLDLALPAEAARIRREPRLSVLRR